MTQPPGPSDNDAILRRLDQLERENQRLREKLEPMLGPDNPNFKSDVFLRVLNRTVLVAMMALVMGFASMFVASNLASRLKMATIGGVPVFSFAGQGGKVRGIGAGLISYGGISVGAIAVGGVSVGIFAVGGCAVGVVAVGGGAVGIIAVGGGACGLVAVGGGNAFGYLAMGQKASGKYALGTNRQDQEAIDFFVRYVPGLRRAVTNPMPVLLLEKDAPAS